MFEMDLTFLIASTAMETEVKRQDFGQFKPLGLQRSLDRQELPPGREGLVTPCLIGRASGDEAPH